VAEQSSAIASDPMTGSVSSSTPPHGAYAVFWGAGSGGSATGSAALLAKQNTTFTGGTINLNWDDLLTGSTLGLTWTALDAELDAVAGQGRPVALAIMAGTGASMFCAAYASECVTLESQKANGGGCSRATVPKPWSTTFASHYGDMIADLAKHLQTTRAVGQSEPRIASLAIIKLEGFQYDTGETFIPADTTPPTGCTPAATLSPAEVWRNAGLTGQGVENAWQTIVQAYSRAFDGTGAYFEMMMHWQGSPPIALKEAAWCGSMSPSTPCPDDNSDDYILLDLVDYAWNTFGDRFISQSNGLRSGGGLIAGVSDVANGVALWKGEKVPSAHGWAGYQMNLANSSDSPPCAADWKSSAASSAATRPRNTPPSTGSTCPGWILQQAYDWAAGFDDVSKAPGFPFDGSLGGGVDAPSLLKVIELYPQDVEAYPSTVATINARLTAE